MAHTESTFKATDGLKLFVQQWTVEQPKAILALVHGMGEHSSRYAHVAEFLNNKDVSVVAFDHRGHGRSEGKRGHTPSFDQLLNDVDLLIAKAREVAPNVPVFLFGHSMGGNVVLNYALRRRPKLNGVIASGPWLRLAFEPPKIQVALAKMVSGLLPALTQPTKLDATAISRDAAVVKTYTNDPLVHDRISTNFFMSAFDAGLWALEHASEFGLPLYIYHGTADRLTSHDASKEFASKVKGDVQWKSWFGLFHECHNEPEKAEVLNALWEWMLKHGA